MYTESSSYLFTYFFLLHQIYFSNFVKEELVNERDAGVRDWSARCLSEFLHWALRHCGGRGESPLDVSRPILERLHSLALHPAPAYRLGAALAFNALYRVLRSAQAVDVLSRDVPSPFLLLSPAIPIARTAIPREGTVLCPSKDSVSPLW